ncbi:hypothetical protein N0V90_006464 [Kalmusia sp. IMI 367209]|nr:hypothetical protein N0V90_006464 [Kalmusia sp. IMI 367209]
MSRRAPISRVHRVFKDRPTSEDYTDLFQQVCGIIMNEIVDDQLRIPLGEHDSGNNIGQVHVYKATSLSLDTNQAGYVELNMHYNGKRILPFGVNLRQMPWALTVQECWRKWKIPIEIESEHYNHEEGTIEGDVLKGKFYAFDQRDREFYYEFIYKFYPPFKTKDELKAEEKTSKDSKPPAGGKHRLPLKCIIERSFTPSKST